MVLAVLLTVDAFTFTVTLLVVVEDELFLLVFPPNRLEIVLVMLVTGFTLLAIALPIVAVAAPITLHKLIHAVEETTVVNLLRVLNLDPAQVAKVNSLRQIIGLTNI